jgi:hypothetical protein
MLLPLPSILQSPPCGTAGDGAGARHDLRRDRASGAAGLDSAGRDGLLRSRFAAGADQAWADDEDFSVS